MEDEATLFIRQPCVFSFEDALKLQPMSRLEMVMSTLDLKPILAMVPKYRTGPKGYRFEAKLRALLAARIERIIGMAALVRRLKYDPIFRFACGFDVIGPVPSEAAFSRFNDKVTKMKGLEPVFQSLVSLAETMELIDGSVVSIDATKLDAYEKSKPQKYISPDGQNADWGVKRDTDGNKTKWFGYKLHQSVDAKSGLPLAITITSASVHDTQPVV
jgi:IS5 family transposase